MALGSLGSDLHASANHSANSAKGSSAAVKSPDVNGVGCLMSVVSVILPEFLKLRAAVQSASGQGCPSLYRAWARLGLSAIRPAGTVLTLILIGWGSAGCSMSRTDSAFASMEGGEVTGSVEPVQSGEGPTEADLAFARNAASDVLTRGAKDSSQPWENPKTGARGSVTPIAAAYNSDGRTCRDFLASYVNGRLESWLQGGACQSGHGQWEIHTLKPWKKG